MTAEDLILEHIETPRLFGRVKGFTVSGGARGPEHEDFIAFQAKIHRGRIVEIAWQGVGCSITLAAASITAEALRGTMAHNAMYCTEQVLDQLHGYSRTCVEVVREAVSMCFTIEEKERGGIKQVL